MDESKRGVYDSALAQLAEQLLQVSARLTALADEHRGRQQALELEHSRGLADLEARQTQEREEQQTMFAQEREDLVAEKNLLEAAERSLAAICGNGQSRQLTEFTRFVLATLIDPYLVGKIKSLSELLAILKKRNQGEIRPVSMVRTDWTLAALSALQQEVTREMAQPGAGAFSTGQLKILRRCYGGVRGDLTTVVNVLSQLSRGLGLEGVAVDRDNHLATPSEDVPVDEEEVQ